MLAGVILYFTGLFSASIALLGDTVESGYLLFKRGSGYPLANGVQNAVQVQELTGGYALVGATELKFFTNSGCEAFQYTHNFSNAAITTGDTRICIYNRGAGNVKVLGRTRLLFEKNFAEPVLFASMNDNGTFAVATLSERYKANICIYNASFDEVMNYSLIDYPLAVCFAPGNRRFAVATVNADGGQLVTRFNFLEIGKDTEQGFITEQSLVVKAKYLSNSNFLAVFDSCAKVYNVNKQQQLYEYSFGGKKLIAASVDHSRYTALAFGDEKQFAANFVVVLNAKLAEVANIDIGEPVEDIVLAGGKVYVLTGTHVLVYNYEGELQKSVELDVRAKFLINKAGVLAAAANSIIDI